MPNINLGYGSGEPTQPTFLYLLTLNSPATYIPVGNLGNMKWGLKVKDADTTNQGDPWMQSIPTLIDGNNLVADLHFIPSSAGADYDANALEGHSFTSGLGYIMRQRQVRQWKLVWPDGAGMFFSAYFSDYPVDMNIEKDLLANCTLKITGEPTFF